MSNQTNLSNITVGDIAEGNTSTDKIPRGGWDEERHLACIEAMLFYRPFDQQHGRKTTAWNEVYKAVNNRSPHLADLGHTAIRKYISMARKEVREKQINDMRASGANDSESILENLILELDQLMSEKETGKEKEEDYAMGTRNQKRLQQALMVEASKRGRVNLTSMKAEIPNTTYREGTQEHERDIYMACDYDDDIATSSFKRRESDYQDRQQQRHNLQKLFSESMEAAYKANEQSSRVSLEIKELLSGMKELVSEIKDALKQAVEENHKIMQAMLTNQNLMLDQMKQFVKDMNIVSSHLYPSIPPQQPPQNDDQQ